MNKLLELQRAIQPIKKDSENPFYKSKYFDINSLIADIKPILNELELIIIQPLITLDDSKLAIETRIIDNDKILAQSVAVLPENNDPQKLGSIITYFRRYALQSLLLLEAEDDDAESVKTSNSAIVASKTLPTINVDEDKPWITDVLFEDAIKKSIQAGVIKLGTPNNEVLLLLRRKYKVAKKYGEMIENTINKYII